MSINQSDVKKIAKLARLAINSEQIEKVTGELTEILAWVEQLNKIETSSILPLAHPVEATEQLRNDVVNEFNNRDTCLPLSAHSEAGLYIVPKVIESPG